MPQQKQSKSLREVAHEEFKQAMQNVVFRCPQIDLTMAHGAVMLAGFEVLASYLPLETATAAINRFCSDAIEIITETEMEKLTAHQAPETLQ